MANRRSGLVHLPPNVVVASLLALAACGEPVSSQQGNTDGKGNLPVAAPASTDPAITVKPVVFVATDAVAPGAGVLVDFQQHLLLARARFTELLSGRDSFGLEKGAVEVVLGAFSTDEYRSLAESGVSRMISEILAHEATDRFDCRHIWVILFANPAEDFPTGGGRPLNGGYNTGCGLVIMSSFSLESRPNFQSTLQHELGHSFGLPHVDVYGYEMGSNESIMSYNLDHHTDGFSGYQEAGVLIPEDRRGLALNDRVFRELEFGSGDVPAGYDLFGRTVWLGPMEIPGQVPYAILASSPDGGFYGTSPDNAVVGVIEPSPGPEVYFNTTTMWHSDSVRAVGAPITLDLEFPTVVALDRILVYSGHSGRYHRAAGVGVAVDRGQGFEEVGSRGLVAQDDGIVFTRTESRTWRLSFETGPSRMLSLRGLRFFDGGLEWFAPLVPPQD